MLAIAEALAEGSPPGGSPSPWDQTWTLQSATVSGTPSCLPDTKANVSCHFVTCTMILMTPTQPLEAWKSERPGAGNAEPCVLTCCVTSSKSLPLSVLHHFLYELKGQTSDLRALLAHSVSGSRKRAGESSRPSLVKASVQAQGAPLQRDCILLTPPNSKCIQVLLRVCWALAASPHHSWVPLTLLPAVGMPLG